MIPIINNLLINYYDNNIITLPSCPNYIIKINDKIRCNDKYNNIIEYEVLEIIDELTFKVKILYFLCLTITFLLKCNLCNF
jgi:hypothetical protein